MLQKLGYLEQFNSHKIAGWVKVLDEFSGYVFVQFEDDEYHKLPVSDRRRDDLPFDCRTFECEVPKRYQVEKFRRVRVYNAEGTELFNSPANIVLSQAEKSKVLRGFDGWLFLTNDSNDFEQYLDGSNRLDDSVIEKWTEICEKRAKVCSKMGVEFRSMIVPEKESIYSRFRPNFKLSSKRPMIVISDICGKFGFVPAFNKDQLLEGSELYYKGDTHWNFEGAYIAFKNLLDSLGLAGSLKELNAFSRRKSYMSGDLRSKLDAVNIELVDHVYNKRCRSQKLIDNGMSSTGRCIEYYNPDAVLPKRILFWHTSSVDWWIPYINSVFSNVRLMWGKSIDWQEVQSFSPDYMVFQTNERFLLNAPVDSQFESVE